MNFQLCPVAAQIEPRDEMGTLYAIQCYLSSIRSFRGDEMARVMQGPKLSQQSEQQPVLRSFSRSHL